MTVTVRTSRARALVSALLLCTLLSLVAVGCVTLTGHEESCRTSTRSGTVSEMSCSGTVETVRGEGPLAFGEDYDDEAEFSGDYRLEMTASVERGRMSIFAEEADGARKGGEVSPGNSLVFEAVGPTEGSVEVEVEGGEDAEVRGLEYEVRLSQV